jgi:hypothetical protein
VVTEIEKYTSRYGKARIVLKENRFFVEASDEKIRDILLNLKGVKEAHKSIMEKNAERDKLRQLE